MADGLYGSLIKFAPAVSVKGGMIHWPKPTSLLSDSGLPKPKPDPALKTIDAVSIDAHLKVPVPAKVIGAEWLHFGYSHVEIAYCNCESTRFDVDDFGRLYIPNALTCSVMVVDDSGNEISRFGGYGNHDSKGPASSVPAPAIPLAYPVAVQVSFKHLYIADSANRRVLRADWTWKAEDTCPVK